MALKPDRGPLSRERLNPKALLLFLGVLGLAEPAFADIENSSTSEAQEQTVENYSVYFQKTFSNFSEFQDWLISEESLKIQEQATKNGNCYFELSVPEEIYNELTWEEPINFSIDRIIPRESDEVYFIIKTKTEKPKPKKPEPIRTETKVTVSPEVDKTEIPEEEVEQAAQVAAATVETIVENLVETREGEEGIESKDKKDIDLVMGMFGGSGVGFAIGGKVYIYRREGEINFVVPGGLEGDVGVRSGEGFSPGLSLEAGIGGEREFGKNHENTLQLTVGPNLRSSFTGLEPGITVSSRLSLEELNQRTGFFDFLECTVILTPDQNKPNSFIIQLGKNIER